MTSIIAVSLTVMQITPYGSTYKHVNGPRNQEPQELKVTN